MREYRHETLGEKAAERDGWEYPRHFDVMGYTVEPEGETIAVKDCADGEPARKIPDEKDESVCAVRGMLVRMRSASGKRRYCICGRKRHAADGMGVFIDVF